MKFCLTLLVLIVALQANAKPIEDPVGPIGNPKAFLLDVGGKVLGRTDFVFQQMRIRREPAEIQRPFREKYAQVRKFMAQIEAAPEDADCKPLLNVLFQTVCELSACVQKYLDTHKNILQTYGFY